MRNPFRRQEKRVLTSAPWVETFDMGGPARPSSYVNQSRALTLAPVFGAVRIIAQDVSSTPIHAYRESGDARIKLPTLPPLFRDLENTGQLIPWLFRLVTSLALRGNAYGLVLSRDGFGFATAILWLNPDDISVDDNTAVTRPTWRFRGVPVPNEDMVHIPWFPLPGQVQGLSPIGAFAETIGLGLQARDYGTTWFQNGGFPPGTFKNETQTITQDQAQTMRSRLSSAMRSGQPLVYGKDWDYKPITVPPNEAQFIETHKLTANDVAAIYGVRAERIGGEAGTSLTYATVTQNQLEHNTSTLGFWVELLEGAFFGLLPERQFVKFNLDAKIRSDPKTRWDIYRIQREIGATNIDEIRALEDAKPLPDGQGQDYTPLKAAPKPANPDQDESGDDNVTPMRRWVSPQ